MNIQRRANARDHCLVSGDPYQIRHWLYNPAVAAPGEKSAHTQEGAGEDAEEKVASLDLEKSAA